MDFVDYVTNPDNLIGTQIPKRVAVNMDNKQMQLNINALTSTQIRQARIDEEKGNGTFAENIVHQSVTGTNGEEIPLDIIQTKIPAGVIDKLSDRIIKYSLYGQ